MRLPMRAAVFSYIKTGHIRTDDLSTFECRFSLGFDFKLFFRETQIQKN